MSAEENKTQKISGKIRWWHKAIVLVISIPRFILASESILAIIPFDTYIHNRFFVVNSALDYPDVFKKDGRLFWKFRRSLSIHSDYFKDRVYRINSRGMRGDEIPPKSDCPRIVALGNSCTFGWGVDYHQTYIKQLEGLVNADENFARVETINAGIPGYTSFQGMKFYKSDVCRLRPDILLIMFGWNDHWRAANNIPDKEQCFPPGLILGIQNRLSSLKLYCSMKKLFLSALDRPISSQYNMGDAAYRVCAEDFRKNLEEIIRCCRGEGVTPILMTAPIPSLEKYYPKYYRSPIHSCHQHYNNMIRGVASSNNCLVVDIAECFNKHDSLYDDAVNDPIHFNARGHRVIAELIYSNIKELQTSDKIELLPAG